MIRRPEIFKVIYENKDLANVKVTTSNADGEKVFSETINLSAGFVRLL